MTYAHCDIVTGVVKTSKQCDSVLSSVAVISHTASHLPRCMHTTHTAVSLTDNNKLTSSSWSHKMHNIYLWQNVTQRPQNI